MARGKLATDYQFHQAKLDGRFKTRRGQLVRGGPICEAVYAPGGELVGVRVLGGRIARPAQSPAEFFSEFSRRQMRGRKLDQKM